LIIFAPVQLVLFAPPPLFFFCPVQRSFIFALDANIITLPWRMDFGFFFCPVFPELAIKIVTHRLKNGYGPGPGNIPKQSRAAIKINKPTKILSNMMTWGGRVRNCASNICRM